MTRMTHLRHRLSERPSRPHLMARRSADSLPRESRAAFAFARIGQTREASGATGFGSDIFGERVANRLTALPLVAQIRSAAMLAIWSLSGEKRTWRTSRFCKCGGRTRRPAARGGEVRQRSLASRPRFRAVAVSSTSSQHTIRGRCYCVRNLYATIRATMLAKITSAGRDFRIIGLGLVEWRAADSPG
jgi:hypothetical protein